VPGLKKGRAIPLLPLWAFMARSRENFTFILQSSVSKIILTQTKKKQVNY
jgi:hypothetical protein